jgi:hypothetical protein
MATLALPLIGIAALALTACDLSRMRPETTRAAFPQNGGATQAAPAPVGSSLSTAPATVQAPAASTSNGAANAAGERSIRLYGPGVSRKRQIRV